MKSLHLFLLVILSFLVACKRTAMKQQAQSFTKLESFVTSFDQSHKLTKVEPVLVNRSANGQNLIIRSAEGYQAMDGFGFSLTGGSAQHLLSLPAGARKDILVELFGSGENSIGVSYLRISLGSSDLDEKAFSYNDLQPGKQDVALENFSLQEDENDLIPVLKEILAINPEIKIMASPWSAPAWMKTNNHTKGGSLRPEYYDSYARYFVKYLKSMAAHGIHIEAITVQNEPLHPGNNPSLYMTPEEQAIFIKQSLGPAFVEAEIHTKIIIYDHNADRIDYPMTVLNDSEAKQYIDGSAFHLYGGKIDNLQELQRAHPDKNLYFTEQWIGAPGDFANDFPWHMKNLIIGASRNWCKTVLEWNLASNQELQPHTDGGCTRCLGAISINDNTVTRNPAYYIIAQASKFVPPGSQRIFSTAPNTLPNVAFQTPNNEVVLIALNEAKESKTINLDLNGSRMSIQVPPAAATTYVFQE